MIDKDKSSATFNEFVSSLGTQVPQKPSKDEFLQVLNDFLYHAVFTVKHLKRGELWLTTTCLDCYMEIPSNQPKRTYSFCIVLTNSMKLTIVGSGGAMPTPRPFCQCLICEKARKEGEPYKRNSSSLFINDIFTLIDCGEDIGDSLNRRNIKRVDCLFITHWHPDHAYGLRPLMEAHFDFFEGKPKKSVKVYLPAKVLEDLKQHYPSISYFVDGLRVATLGVIEHEKSVRLGNMKVTAVGFKGEASSLFAYLLEEKNKRVLYAPCDTIHFEQKVFNLDLLITECGLFSYEKIKSEISFPAMMKNIELLKPKRTILTHIEEDEINTWGWNYLNRMKEQYAYVDFDFAYDGMEIEV